MASKDHLSPWPENEHQTKPAEAGCVWRHADYGDKKFPRCDYRKNAHDHSKASETQIYNVPSFRSPERWVEVWLDSLGPTIYKKSKKLEKGSTPLPLGKVGPVWNHVWDLGVGENFQDWKVPYWHNTHHVIACGEIGDAFNEDERKLLLKTQWNINEMPNVIILPKQVAVARILKLPWHVPPDGPTSHDNYSGRIGTQLNSIKSKLAKNANQTGHELTDQTAPDARKELEKASKAMRDWLIQMGEKNPGVNLDNLKVDSVNW